MKKLVIFDLDGVLVDSKKIHHNALNNALYTIDPKFVISEYEMKNIYEGLPTKKKLEILTQEKNLDKSDYDAIFSLKQDFTNKELLSIKKDNELINLISYIKSKNIYIAVASNSIRDTIKTCLFQLGIDGLIDYVVSNEDIKNSKPHPEIYWKAMSNFSVTPQQTVIFEDSIAGQTGAANSGAHLISISQRSDLDIEKINYGLSMLKKRNALWTNNKINIVIPMAGLGSRFSDAGYDLPKPLINVDGLPMIKLVVDNLSIIGNYTFIVQKSHYRKYNLEQILKLIAPNCNIIQVDGVTDGAASTVLLAESIINNDQPLLIANSDQLVEWSSQNFFEYLIKLDADGGIAIFNGSGNKWSYAIVDEMNRVTEVAEKQEISDKATVGFYYWKHGSEFVKYAKKMIDKNLRVNDEFYICPVYNEAIRDKKIIYAFPVKSMHSLGTPEDLENYLRVKYD